MTTAAGPLRGGDGRAASRTSLPVLGGRGEPRTGSYFVSAYPPFSQWSETAAGELRVALGRGPIGAPAEPAPLGLYLHVPFCDTRCDYCYYLSYADRPEAVGPYLAALTAELGRWMATPALAGRPLDFVYFGGGTPSLLSVGRLARLLPALRSLAPWDRAREVSFECAPASVTADKLELLAGEGVTRLSLGIQQLDDRVLALNRRSHRVADVERAWEAIRRTGFAVTNVDLIAGLPGQTDESFLEGLERTIGMQPDCVTVYALEVPWNTPLFRRVRDLEAAAAPASWQETRQRLGAGFERLEAAGFSVRSAYTAVRDPARHPFVYQDAQYRGADLLGVGVSAFSYLGGWHHQNRAMLDGYLERVEAGDLPWGRAYRLSADERAVRSMVLELKLGAVERSAFAAAHGVDPAERFAEPLAALAAEGLAEIDAASIRLTRPGLLQADHLLPRFYRPEHRAVRYS